MVIKMVSAMLLTILFAVSFQTQAATATTNNKTSNNKAVKFDHTQTGFILKDVHLTLQCEQCHVDGIFKNTPTYCSGCHAPGTRVGAMPQPLNHVQTSAACDTCHTSTASFQVKSFNHMGVTGNCTSCHNGQSLGVVSMSSTHIPLSAYPTAPDCSVCHTNTTTFAGYTNTGTNLHAGILSGCSQCHGGPPGADAGNGTVGTYPGVVSYNSATHLPLTTQVNCNLCHFTFSTFLGATYTHTSNDSSRCGNCHEGQYAGVLPFVSGVHIPLPTGSNCAPCHVDPSLSPATKPSFLGSAFHTSSFGVTAAAVTSGSGTCKSCHNGSYASQNAQAVGTTHIPISADCSVCHTDATGTPVNNTSSYTTFKNSLFHLSSAGASPGTCATCHNGSYTSEGAQSKTSILPNHIPVSGDCGTCHTAANTGTYTSFLNAIFHQSPAGATATAADAAGGGQCVTCHNGSYSAQLAQPVGATHIPFTADCSVCHTDSAGTPANNTSGYTTFLNAKFHQSSVGTSPAGLCSTCHNGSYVTEGAYSTSSVISNHVTVAAGVDCVACHTIASTSSFTTFLNATYAHSATYGATFPQATGQSPTCASCHNGTTAKGIVAGHVTFPATQDCNACHTPSTDGCGTTGNCLNFSGVIYNHTTANTPYAAGNFPANGTTANPRCDTCHNGSTLLAQPVNTGHVPTGTSDCNYCHTPADTGCSTTGTCSTFFGAKFNHGSVTAGTCGTCHQNQYANVVSLASITHIPQSNGNACDACHLAANTGIAGAFPATAQTFAGASYHTTVGTSPSTCSNCHNGAYTPGPSSTTYGINSGTALQGALAMNSVSGYTHIATTADCNVCHTSGFSSTSFGSGTPTVTTSRSVMVHNGTTTPPNGCGTCHLGQYPTVISLASSHIPQSSGNACDICHTSAISSYTVTGSAVFTGVFFHQNSLGNPPTGTCSSCHTSGYTPAATVSGASGTNVGLAATGASTKSSIISTHVSTSADCVTCHTLTNTANYTTFLGASGYNHTATYPTWTTATTVFPSNPASPTCASCHNGTTATGINSGHPAVGTTDCVSCHTSSILVGCPSCSLFGVPAGVIHNTTTYTAASGGCVSCHNGTTAKGSTSDANHIPFGTADCAKCHPVYDGTTSIDFSTTATTTLTPLPSGGVSKYTMAHSALTTGTLCSSCHGVATYAGQGTLGALAKPSNHIPVTIAPAGSDCTFCHNYTLASLPTTAAALTTWNTLVSSTTLHNGNSGGGVPVAGLYCVTCHLSSATYLVPSSAGKQSHKSASTSTDCSKSSCHKPLGGQGSTYTSW